jgi:hypothetical protein
MTMLKTLGAAVDMTATGALAAVELGETPFFPGANAILRLSAPVGGAGVIQVQGSTEEAGTFTTIATVNAASGTDVEITDLPKWIRLNKSTIGTGTIATVKLEGVQ